jgi:cellulose synthase/poly-beta-1,6-N-acetylglucosamine synthase-like glycosyltransferase
MAKATVTVLVPCFNYAQFLRQCVRSVLRQSYADVDVLVIDDASTDHSMDVVETLAREESRVRFVSLSKNIGMVPAINRGLTETLGEYFVKLDADDLLTPGALARSVELLESNRDIGFVYGRPCHFIGDVPPRARIGKPREVVWSGRRWLEVRYGKAANCISQPEAMIRTSALRLAGIYNESLPHTSDLEMWLRLAALGPVGRINGVDQGYYRVHPNSMQRTVNAGLLNDFRGRRGAFIGALPAIGDRSLAQRLEATVRKKLAGQALDCCCRAYDRARVRSVPIKDLLGFANETYADVTSLPEWRQLERRRRRGLRSRWSPRSFLAAVIRRSREEVAHARWISTGL